MNCKKSFRFMGILSLALMMLVSYVAVANGQKIKKECQELPWDCLYKHSKTIVDPIKTDAGYVSGTLVGDVENPVRIFRGIPYAAPPVGNLRWKPPQPVTPWGGILECTQFSLWAPQPFPAPITLESKQESEMGEDCLYVNVLTPAKYNNYKDPFLFNRNRLPVMVWFHGGAYSYGSGNALYYNSVSLAQRGVVLVTVNHRVGSLGYFNHPALTAELGHGVSAFGQLDAVAALQWVQRNIAAFGGDPDNVTIFGESGGGSKVNWLMSSPLAKGLFHRAICESGGTGDGVSLSVAEQYGVNLAAKVGVSGVGPEALAALRSKTWQELVIAAATPGSGYSATVAVDGWSLQDTYYNIFAQGKQHDVPYLIGINGGDLTSIFNGTKSFVPSIKQGQSKVYAYLFTHVPAGWKNDGVPAFHILEIQYLFDALDRITLYYNSYAKQLGAKSPDPGLDEKDLWIPKALMAMWTQFAETGNPSVKGLVEWPPYVNTTDKYLNIKIPLEVQSGFSTLIYPVY